MNDFSSPSGAACEIPSAHMGQWFKPTQPNLVAVELVLVVHSNWVIPAEGVELRLDIRDGGPGAPALAAATTHVPGTLPPQSRIRPHFDLATPLQGTAGKSLFLDLTVPVREDGFGRWLPMFSWRGRDDDPYPGGSLMCFQSPSPLPIPPPDLRFDFNFITFWEGDGSDHVCPQISNRVPQSAILWALANPGRVAGYNELERPGVPEGPYNRLRTRLSIQRMAVPFHPLWNRLVYRSGCP